MKSEKSVQNGKVVEYYDNKKIKFTGSYKDGKMNDFWVFYRKDGSIMRDGSFELGERIGNWRTYARDGKIVKTTIFK